VLTATVYATTSPSAERGMSQFLFSTFGLYVILFLVTRLAIGRVVKWRARSAPAPREETA
jgi:hypothetical protein